MSKIATCIVVVLLVIVAAGSWAIFAVENERKQLELRQLEAQQQGTLEAEGYSAWRHSTRYDTFWIPLVNSRQEPKRNETLTSREVWVKSFQRPDIKAIGKSQKYGNAAYYVTTTVAFRDKLSKGMFDVALRSRVASDVVFAAAQGQWHNLTMQCKVERLDGGEWIASDYKFSPIDNKPDFPFEQVKGDD
jgi:hypothetical protein